MAVSTRLHAYLTLERVMLELDQSGDPLADRIRDLMDPVWYDLSDEEHSALDRRADTALESLHPIRLPAGEDLFVEPSATGRRTVVAQGQRAGLCISGWEMAA
jgi:hypothetical protein